MTTNKTILTFGIAMFYSVLLHANGISLECPADKPTVLKTLPDRKIALYDMEKIPTAGVFGGPQLTLSVSASPHKPKNAYGISSRMGNLVINAAEKDKFDVTLTASNGCGHASTKFQVVIDEEN